MQLPVVLDMCRGHDRLLSPHNSILAACVVLAFLHPRFCSVKREDRLKAELRLTMHLETEERKTETGSAGDRQVRCRLGGLWEIVGVRRLYRMRRFGGGGRRRVPTRAIAVRESDMQHEVVQYGAFLQHVAFRGRKWEAIWICKSLL